MKIEGDVSGAFQLTNDLVFALSEHMVKTFTHLKKNEVARKSTIKLTVNNENGENYSYNIITTHNKEDNTVDVKVSSEREFTIKWRGSVMLPFFCPTVMPNY